MIEAAPRDVENVADSADAQTGLIFDRTDHLAPFFCALVPRITAACFKMLFSSRSRDTSRLRTRNLSATASSPSARWPPLPSCEFLTHLRRRPSPIPNSLASSGIGLPALTALTRPTAWSLTMAEEVTALCRAKHHPAIDSEHRRAGSESGVAYLGREKEPITRPRVRSDEGEVQLATYAAPSTQRNLYDQVISGIVAGGSIRGVSRERRRRQERRRRGKKKTSVINS